MENVNHFIKQFLKDNLVETTENLNADVISKPTQFVWVSGDENKVFFKNINLKQTLFVEKLNDLLESWPFYFIIDEASDTIKLVQMRRISKDDLLTIFEQIFKAINLTQGSKEATLALLQYGRLFYAYLNTDFEYLVLPQEK